jgi:hypothetical protein
MIEERDGINSVHWIQRLDSDGDYSMLLLLLCRKRRCRLTHTMLNNLLMLTADPNPLPLHALQGVQPLPAGVWDAAVREY